MKDDDERLPIHWAAAYNRLPVVELLVAMKDFDPDVEVSGLELVRHRDTYAFWLFPSFCR